MQALQIVSGSGVRLNIDVANDLRLDQRYQDQVSLLEAGTEATNESLPIINEDLSFIHCHQHYTAEAELGDAAHSLLPAYVQPFPSRIGPDELALLQQKGAHIVPNLELRNELLRNYLEFVHPSLPVLDIRDLLSNVELNGHGSRVSLLLFQSVMFAGSAFVSEHHLLSAGFPDRKEARKHFFQKIKVRLNVFVCQPSSTDSEAGVIRYRL